MSLSITIRLDHVYGILIEAMVEKENSVKARNVFVLFFIVMIALSGEYVVASFASTGAKAAMVAKIRAHVAPNVLEVQRVPALSNGQIANVAQPQLVQAIYSNVLSLPKRPKGQICPDYITAEFQLAFLHGSSSVLMATALQGGCALVDLGDGDIRIANTS